MEQPSFYVENKSIDIVQMPKLPINRVLFNGSTSFSFIVDIFQRNNALFGTTNQCEETSIKYTVLGFEPNELLYISLLQEPLDHDSLP